MKRKAMLTVIVVVLCLAPLARGQHIVMISGHDTRDLGWVDLLEAQGYTVERITDKYEDTVSAADWTALGEADLIIMSRSVGNGSNHDGDLASWNGLTTPIINMCARASANDRWGWLDTATGQNSNHSSDMAVIDPTDTIFAGLDLPLDPPEYNVINVLSHDQVKFLQTSNAGNGEVLARRSAGNDYVWIVRWAAGVPFYASSASPAAARMLFVAGEEDDNGEINLNIAGQTIFLNAVYEMSGATFDRPPVVDAGGNQVVRLEGASVEVRLDASVTDVDTLPENLTYSWSGPGASFRDGIDNVEDVNAIFTAAGEYELTLEVNDGETTASGTVMIVVTGDVENILVAHWELDDGSGLTASDSAFEYDNIGDIITPGEPNWADGWVGTGSYMFYGDTHVEITTDANSVSGDPNTPNLDNIKYGVTMAAWVRIDQDNFVPGSEDDDGNVLFKRNSWYLRYYGNRMRMRVNNVEAADDTLRGSIDIRDGYWHHVAGVYDGQYMVVYVDGVEDTRQEAAGFVQPSAHFAAIGANVDLDDPAYRYWKGNIDDARVYSYGLTADEIEELANDAPRVPMVNAGDDQEYNINPALPLALEGSVIDLDPVPPTVEWSVAPESPGAAANVEFDDVSDPQSIVTFTAGGVFILRLTATDSVGGEEVVISDDITITAVAPTCQKVVDDGLLLKSDLNGDCYIGLADLAIIALEWGTCNDPENQTVCDWPF